MTKISNMVTAGPLMGSELIEVVQGGVNKQITAGQLFSSGKSSYQLAVDRGFVGSEASFLASLKGTQGVQGVQGVEGVFGTPGIQGIPGAAGPKGTDGIPGVKGADGVQGIPGTLGATGAAGIQGIPGIDGAAGAKGDAGIQGIPGIDGAIGAKGDIGLTGVQGVQGPKGDMGAKGDTGAMGTGLKILGSLENPSQLIDPAQRVEGDTYVILGHFWSLVNGAWADLGNVQGPAGSSAYDIAVVAGFVGTFDEWLLSLRGQDGIGLRIMGTFSSTTFLPEQALNGDAYIVDAKLWVWDGVQWSAVGQQGTVGTSAYQAAVGAGFVGTLTQWFTSLKGKSAYEEAKSLGQPNTATELGWIASLKGLIGDTGAVGITGAQGVQGLMGPGITILGKLNATSELPATPGTFGQGYLIAGHFWGWTGAAYEDLGVIQGPKGDQGLQGIQGLQGLKGDAGLQGAIGTTGLAGMSAFAQAVDNGFVGTLAGWVTSLKGISGVDGVRGPKGDPGQALKLLGTLANAGLLPAVATDNDSYVVAGELFTRITGAWVNLGPIQGAKGDVGLTGVQGLIGLTGAQGLKGDQGIQGVIGATGSQGPQGTQGTTGNVGSIGPIGIQGAKGDVGTGLKIMGAFLSSSELPATAVLGDAYLINLDFWVYNGTAFVNAGAVKGAKGDLGVTGAQGTKGDTGTQGIQGIQGIQGNTGATGAVGSTGTTGLTGAKGDIGTGLTVLGKFNTSAELPATAKLADGYLVGVDLWVYNGTAFVNVGPVRGPQGLIGLTGAQGLKGDQGIQGVIGANGVKGDIGVTGAKGDTGAVGAAFKPKGALANTAALAGVVGPIAGDTYLIAGIVWSYDGATFVNMGSTKGDTGLSALDIAKLVDSAITTDAEFILSLKGTPGTVGATGDQGVLGPKGDIGITGPTGPQGLMGPGITLLGKLDTTAALPTTGQYGQGYLVTGNFWGWTGTAFENLGPIQGPKGDIGGKGDVGATGANGIKGDTGVKGDVGTKWILLNRNPQALDGRINDGFFNTATQEVFLKVSATLWATQGHLGGGNVYDASFDDVKYVRLNGVWTPLLVDEAPKDGKQYARVDGNWVVTTAQNFGPVDGKKYVLKNGAYIELPVDALAAGSTGYYVRTVAGWVKLDRYDVAVAATTGVLDLAVQQVFTISATVARTISFANVPDATRAMTAVVNLTGTGGTITWPASITWAAGSAPVLAATITVVVLYWTGTQWVGVLSVNV
jgi:hypothetical protein